LREASKLARPGPYVANLYLACAPILEPMEVLEFEKKVLLIGEASVGKTSLVRRFVIDRFDDRYIVTIGTKVSRKVMDFEYPGEGVAVSLMMSVWDVIGQRSAERVHEMYFKGAEAFILVCDGTRRETFEAVGDWAFRARRVAGPVPGVLACNKADLKAAFKVTDAEVRAKAQGLGLAPLFTSAKTGENVEEAFRQIGEGLSRAILAKRQAAAR